MLLACPNSDSRVAKIEGSHQVGADRNVVLPTEVVELFQAVRCSSADRDIRLALVSATLCIE